MADDVFHFDFSVVPKIRGRKMSYILRIVLLLGAVLTAWMIVNKIRRSKMKMNDAIFWVIFGLLLLVLAIVPELSYFMANLFGITSPANFIFLAIIALLCEKLLTVTIKLSQLEEKVEIMAAEIAIRTQKTEQKEQELRNRGGNGEGIVDSDHV